MEYKGYIGEAFYDHEMKLFSGRVANAEAGLDHRFGQ